MDIEQELRKFCEQMNLVFVGESTDSKYKFLYRNRPDNPHYNWGVGLRKDGTLGAAGRNFNNNEFDYLKEYVISLLKEEKIR